MTDLQDKFHDLKEAMDLKYYERYDETEIAIASLLCRYHTCLIGPPGTAKSMMADDLTDVFKGARLFKRLIGKFTTPEELFGPLDMKKLKEGKYERITKGKLPEAELAFVDEWFKANAAIQNDNLTIMNERLYDNGTGRMKVPLISLFAASNELPEGEELWALFDRFHFRKVVNYITEPGNFIKLFMEQNSDVVLPTITLEELEEAQEEVLKVKIPETVGSTVYDIRADLGVDGVVVSDRRMKQARKPLQALAWLDGRDVVSDDDFRILEHMLWTQPQEQKRVAKVIRKHTNPLEIKVQEIMDVTEDISQQLYAALVEAKAKGVEPTDVLVKQGIEWFTNCRKLHRQLLAIEEEAKEAGRPLNRVKQAQDQLGRVMKDIGRHTIGLDDNDMKQQAKK